MAGAAVNNRIAQFNAGKTNSAGERIYQGVEAESMARQLPPTAFSAAMAPQAAAPMAPQGGAPFIPPEGFSGFGGFLPGNPPPADFNRPAQIYPAQIYNPPADDPRDPRSKGMQLLGGAPMAPQGNEPAITDREIGQRYLPPEPNSMGGPTSEGRFVGPENPLYNTLQPYGEAFPASTPMPVPTQQPSGFKGGVGGAQPAPMPTPMPVPAQQPQYAPMAAQGQFNVNQASAGALQQAMGATQQGLGFTPQGIGAQTYQPSQIAGTDLSPYTNPYETQVIQQSLSDLGGAQEKALNQLGAQAEAARAFGGSRQGIAEAETRKAYGQQAADLTTSLRQQGYQTALGLAGQDVGAQTAAQQYAAQQRASAQAQNLAAQQSAASTRLSAASQLGQLGQQAFGTGQAIQQQQMQQGLLQQGIQQALIDAARQQYAGYTGAPTTALQAPLAALGVTPAPQTTTNTMQPGLFNYLQLGASMVPK